MSKLRVVQAELFAAVDEPSAEALLGDGDDAEIAAGCTVMFYGDAGSSKTTLEIDAAVHFATGADWLGFRVARALRVLIVEAEGPRGPFRRKIARKLDYWSAPCPNLLVVEEPWGELRLDRDEDLAALREVCEQEAIDVLMMGPAASLGFTGAGTPDDIEAHARRLALLRDGLSKPLVVWLVHHENKAGDVSGAWERLPDTFVHVRLGDGGGYSILHWRKVRWSSRTHGRKMHLRWTDGEGFEPVDEDARVAKREAALDDASEWIREYVSQHPGEARSAVENAYVAAHDGKGRSTARTVIDSQLAARQAQAENPGANGEHSWLATGPGRAANGIYLYPASGASSPLAIDLNGERGEHPSNPAECECSPLAAPYRGSGSDGEQRAGSPVEALT